MEPGVVAQLGVERRGEHRALAAEDGVVVEASGRELVITHPDKVFFEERGDTKLDLVRYYQAVEGPLLSAMQNANDLNLSLRIR